MSDELKYLYKYSLLTLFMIFSLPVRNRMGHENLRTINQNTDNHG